MTKSEEVIDALRGDCTRHCGGTHRRTDLPLSAYLQDSDIMPGDDQQFAWTCDRCGSTVFRQPVND